MLKRVEKPEWLRTAEEFEASGLTQREFAQGRGLRLSTLQSWVYRRRRQVSTEVQPSVRLLPVQVGPAPMANEGEPMELTTASGVRVRFRTGTDVDYLALLVAALGHTAC